MKRFVSALAENERSELFILKLIADQAQPVPFDQLEDVLLLEIRDRRSPNRRFRFAFGHYESLADFLLKQAAVGAVRLELDPTYEISRVSLTDHGQRLVGQAPRDLRHSLGFA